MSALQLIETGRRLKLWIRIDAALRSDPNVAELASRLNISTAEAAGHCVFVWAAIAEHRPDGNLAGISSAALEDWAGYRKRRGKPTGAFARVFRELFLSDGMVKGWADRQGKLLERAEKERARKFRGTSAESVQDSAPTERNGTEQQQTSSVADGCVPEGALLALRKLLGTARNPQAAAHEIKAYADGLRAPLCPTPDQLGRAVLDFAANGSEWSAAHFRAYVKRAIAEDSKTPRNQTPRLSKQEIGRQNLEAAIARRAASNG